MKVTDDKDNFAFVAPEGTNALESERSFHGMPVRGAFALFQTIE